MTVERQRLVLTTVADAIQTTASPRRAPSVAFEQTSTTGVRGNYDGRHNRVRIRVPGFLDDPTVADNTIRAAVLHEIGHWADRWDRPSAYGIATGGLMSIVGPIVCSVGIALVFGADRVGLGGQTVIAGLAIGLLGAVIIAACSWPAEYRADAFAADRVGAPAVRTMVATRRTRDSFTHPGLARRTARLTRTPAT